MRLTILNQFFYPDHSATSQLMTALAEDLVQHGVQVTALASRGAYNGGAAFAARETHAGVQIERVWATNFGKTSLAGRLCDYLTFYLGAFWKLLTLPNTPGQAHVVMALTTPPLIGLVALLVGRWRGLRFVALQEDMYPEVAVALGALRPDSWVTRLLERLTNRMLQHADRIIVLSDCMLERVLAKLGPAARPRIDVIHNWADGREIMPLAGVKTAFWAERGLPALAERFVVLFGGNLGLVNEFTTVLEAARLLAHRDDIAFVFIGEGARRPAITEFIRQHSLTNIITLPYQPRAALPQSLGAADALLLTLAEGLAGLSVPSKTYSNLAAGRPLLFVGDLRSSSAALIQQAGCGAALASGQALALAETVSGWAGDPAQVHLLGRRARQVFEERFDRPHAVRAYWQALTRCVAQSSTEAGPNLTDYPPLEPVKLKEPVS
jgi:colanic acid biosynthesis glycosyl transferase WcaI